MKTKSEMQEVGARGARGRVLGRSRRAELSGDRQDASAAERWRAVVERDRDADGTFVFGVSTTGIYCRPSCAAKRALRKNVRFFGTPSEAERAGFRACLRCRPRELSERAHRARAVAAACEIIARAAKAPDLRALAEAVGLSASHFHRVFKAETGLTPKAWAMAERARRARGALRAGDRVLSAVFGAGYASTSRFYADAQGRLGMNPTAVRHGGRGTTIRYAVGRSALGIVCVAATDVGVCWIALGDDADELVREARGQFPEATWIAGDAAFTKLIARVITAVEKPTLGVELPLDVRGTAFQERVWQRLRTIPPGETRTYSEIAQAVGKGRAVRAVAGACAANPVAVVIPCHRVVRTDGTLSGYRWGVARKAQLLARERGPR